MSGFAGLWKGKNVAKEPSPEPTASKEVADDAPVITEAPASVPVEPSTETEEPQTTATPEIKNKRASIFSGLLPKSKDKSTSTALTNGDAEAAPATTAPETSDPVSTSEPTPAPTDDTEIKPPTPKKDSLGRRLTSQFKALGRSKSPEKTKATKVSDEAPKIDTAIGTTSEAPAANPDATAAAVEPEEKKVEAEPLTTTEAPSTSEHAPATTTIESSAPAVSTQA